MFGQTQCLWAYYGASKELVNSAEQPCEVLTIILVYLKFFSLAAAAKGSLLVISWLLTQVR